jgi:hypothetical protein
MKQSILFFFLIALVGSVNGQKKDTIGLRIIYFKKSIKHEECGFQVGDRYLDKNKKPIPNSIEVYITKCLCPECDFKLKRKK